MHQSRTLDVGMDVHQASITGAEVAQDQGAAVVSLGTLGPRPGASATLLRPLQAQSQQLVVVYAAGPCGDWL